MLGLLGRTDEALEALAKARATVPTWTLALYEKGIRVTWRNKEELVEPTVAGLRKLGIDEDGGSKGRIQPKP